MLWTPVKALTGDIIHSYFLSSLDIVKYFLGNHDAKHLPFLVNWIFSYNKNNPVSDLPKISVQALKTCRISLNMNRPHPSSILLLYMWLYFFSASSGAAGSDSSILAVLHWGQTSKSRTRIICKKNNHQPWRQGRKKFIFEVICPEGA